MAEDQQTQAPAAAPQEPTEKSAVQSFNLKEIESQLLIIIRNNQNAIFSAVLSTIATDRLGYKVTQRTQFELDGDLKTMKISELPEPPVPTEPADGAAQQNDAPAQPPETPPDAPKSGAVAAP